MATSDGSAGSRDGSRGGVNPPPSTPRPTAPPPAQKAGGGTSGKGK